MERGTRTARVIDAVRRKNSQPRPGCRGKAPLDQGLCSNDAGVPLNRGGRL